MSGAATTARAWAVTRRDGVVLGFTDHDQVLAFEGISFRPDTGMAARAIVQAAGLSVDNSEADGILSDDAITELDLLAGRWDEAEVRLWDVDWTNPMDRRLMFRGHLGEVSRSGAAFRAELRGLSEPLNQPAGRVFHPLCAARLGDGACKVDLTAPGMFTDATILNVGEGVEFQLEAAGFDDRWFERGRLQVLDGAAAGLSGMVKNDRARAGSRRELELWQSLGILPAAGDRVRLTAGCDKRGTTCRLKFGNYLNFRGFPHLPPEDWLLAPQVIRRRG